MFFHWVFFFFPSLYREVALGPSPASWLLLYTAKQARVLTEPKLLLSTQWRGSGNRDFINDILKTGHLGHLVVMRMKVRPAKWQDLVNSEGLHTHQVSVTASHTTSPQGSQGQWRGVTF